MTVKRRPFDEARLRETIELLKENNGNIRKTARDLGCSQKLVQNLIDAADSAGMFETEPCPALRQAPVSRLRSFTKLREDRIAEYERRKLSGTAQSHHVIDMPDDGPFGLIAIGDPHYDDPGTDLEDYERWTAPLEKKSGAVYGLLLGDLLNNWVFPKLARLHGEQTTMQDEAWVLVETYVKRIANKLLASCSGNHDDWSNADLIGWIMDKNGVLHRKIGISLSLRTPSGYSVSVAMRHRWSGRSQWNAVHAITKAAQLGRREDILIGGDKHISGEGFVKCPSTGKITNCHQVASFKKIDDYGEELGLPDQHVTPAIGLLVDPARPNTDKQRVITVYDPDLLVDMVQWLRKKQGYK
jgi:hypothetical protein